MPAERIELGAAANDGKGDPLRIAFGKVNRNIDWLASSVAARIAQLPIFAHLRHDHDDYVPRHLGAGPPNEAPTRWGSMWIDTVSGKIYLAAGTGSRDDWREIRFTER